ncbi:MAG: helix-turn-helix transcriptional regulator [Polyangia bacterium]
MREDGTITDCGADAVIEIAAGRSTGEPANGVSDDLAVRVAERLKAYREGHNLTQRVMAKRIGMAPSNYNRLESGKHTPTPPTLLRIAEAMGIPLGRLVSA